MNKIQAISLKKPSTYNILLLFYLTHHKSYLSSIPTLTDPVHFYVHVFCAVRGICTDSGLYTCLKENGIEQHVIVSLVVLNVLREYFESKNHNNKHDHDSINKRDSKCNINTLNLTTEESSKHEGKSNNTRDCHSKSAKDGKCLLSFHTFYKSALNIHVLLSNNKILNIINKKLSKTLIKQLKLENTILITHLSDCRCVYDCSGINYFDYFKGEENAKEMNIQQNGAQINFNSENMLINNKNSITNSIKPCKSPCFDHFALLHNKQPLQLNYHLIKFYSVTYLEKFTKKNKMNNKLLNSLLHFDKLSITIVADIIVYLGQLKREKDTSDTKTTKIDTKRVKTENKKYYIQYTSIKHDHDTVINYILNLPFFHASLSLSTQLVDQNTRNDILLLFNPFITQILPFISHLLKNKQYLSDLECLEYRKYKNMMLEEETDNFESVVLQYMVNTSSHDHNYASDPEDEFDKTMENLDNNNRNRDIDSKDYCNNKTSDSNNKEYCNNKTIDNNNKTININNKEYCNTPHSIIRNNLIPTLHFFKQNHARLYHIHNFLSILPELITECIFHEIYLFMEWFLHEEDKRIKFNINCNITCKHFNTTYCIALSDSTITSNNSRHQNITSVYLSELIISFYKRITIHTKFIINFLILYLNRLDSTIFSNFYSNLVSVTSTCKNRDSGMK